MKIELNNGLKDILLTASGIFIILLSFLFFIGVILRYIMRVSFGEMQIIIRICISWCVFLSGAAALEGKKHLTLDIFNLDSLRFSSLRKAVTVLGDLLILFIILCMVVSSHNSLIDSMKRIEPINRKFNQSYFYYPFFIGSILLLFIHVKNVVIKPIYKKINPGDKDGK